MPIADFSAIDVLWICLSVFLVVVGLALAVMLLRFAGTARRLTSLLGGVEERAVPLITEVGGTVERVNEQLDKADIVTTSAVDAVTAVDRGVRGVAGAVSWPVRKISSLTTGVRYGGASLRTEGDVNRAYDAGRAAARRRASDFNEEMAGPSKRETGEPPGASLSSPDATASWMDAHESETLERARTAGRRRAESEASEESGEHPPAGAGG